MIRIIAAVIIIASAKQGVYSQTNNLTGSPYSIFGLGVESNSNTGRNSGMGRLGIALENENQINLFNPASFASIEKERFIFDIGIFTEIQRISSNGTEEPRFASNFSNVALGFNGNGKYGIGLALRPATNVGYALIGLESNVEGSNEQFITNILGSGGLNEIRLDYGRTVLNNLKLGLSFSYLFGNIDETESIILENSSVQTNDISYYNGATLGFGIQYKLKDLYNFGVTLELPTRLNGSQDTSSRRLSTSGSSILEESLNKNIDDLFMPLSLGFGVSTSFKNFLIAAEYTGNYWSNTEQEDGLGSYVDQNIFALGAEFSRNPFGLKYWQRINFRAGISYNTGYLKIEDTRVDNLNASLGLGLPLSSRNGSNLNISYNFGNRGSNNNFLVVENFSTININLTISSIWFQQRKYD